MPTVQEIAKMMNDAYAANTAYRSNLPFDSMRMHEIHDAVLTCAKPTVEPGHRTLDVGSGQGGIVHFWPHKNIVGVEISQVAIEQARQRYPGVEYICSPIEGFRWEGEPFDIAVAQESIEHWVDVDAGLDNIRASLRTGAPLVLSTPNRDSLHCRLFRKFGREAPLCSHDHIHEFGFQELIDRVCQHGFKHSHARGACLAPYWALEEFIGNRIRQLTDSDIEVNTWMNEIARYAPPEYSFIQVHRFDAV